MATNAPYYQMRGQFTSTANTQFVPDDVDEYDLSASVAPHDAALYSDRQPSETPITSLEENHNFVELLEAATTAAAGQAARAMDIDSTGSGAAMLKKGKRKRVSSPVVDEPTHTISGHGQGDTASSSKRPRLDVPTDPQLHSTGEIHGTSEGSNVPPSSESLLNDARAAGVHSAAALFRRHSEKSNRKYTRPPMSKLFVSLQLTSENFLLLQAQAKAYMLDGKHPERQSCIGNRGKGDTDMIRLRLFNCVRDFLNEGAGEEFFGQHVEKPGAKDAIEAARALGEERAPGEDKLIWPRDGNKIISLITPLLRRMVTNERQRIYAIETRKGGARKKATSVDATSAQDNTQGMSAPNVSAYLEQAPTITPDLTHLQSLSQGQHPHPTSPISSLPVQLSISTQDLSPTAAMAEGRKYERPPSNPAELAHLPKLPLPTYPPAEPVMNRLTIFLVKNGVKLEGGVQLFNLAAAPLYFMTWEEFSDQVRDVVTQALYRYPQLREEMKQKQAQATETQAQGMGPEALRGLAVAATEIQNEPLGQADANEGTTARSDSFRSGGASVRIASTECIAPSSRPQTPPNLALSLPSDVLPERLLPKFSIWTIWSLGKREINNGEDWHKTKLDIAYAVWTDGTLNVVVDLL